MTSLVIRSWWDHPRIRGEHAVNVGPNRRRRGSSPHTRGAPTPAPPIASPSWIIPAYAGSTPHRQYPETIQKDHPRIRGEHSLYPSVMAGERGSSPHTRGARGRDVQVTRPARIIPAYAGSTWEVKPGRYEVLDHPRIRGEHLFSRLAIHHTSGSSPHTRGALPSAPQGRKTRRIIPAYAGSTRDADAHGGAGADHPRIRGEHRGTGARP